MMHAYFSGVARPADVSLGRDRDLCQNSIMLSLGF